jgi:hypothetical protein
MSTCTTAEVIAVACQCLSDKQSAFRRQRRFRQEPHNGWQVEPTRRAAATDLDSLTVHALSNHLAVILGFVDLVLGATAENDPRRKDLMEIRNAAAEAAKIIGRPIGD